jgi:hypothetical protein
MMQFLILAASFIVAASSNFDGLWRTFGHQKALPLTVDEATQQGWNKISQSCDENLGILYTQDPSGPTQSHPLGVYFTSAGQVAGVQTTVREINFRQHCA